MTNLLILGLALLGYLAFKERADYKKVQNHLAKSGTESGCRLSIIADCTGLSIRRVKQLMQRYSLGA